jgi:chromosome segregation ATPase
MPVSPKLTPPMIFAACFELREADEVINPYRVWLKCGKVGSTSTAKKPVEAWLSCERGEAPSERRFQDLYDRMRKGDSSASSDNDEAESEEEIPEAVLRIVEKVAREVWQHASAHIEEEVREVNQQEVSVVEDALAKLETANKENEELKRALARTRAERTELQEKYEPLRVEHESLEARYQELSAQHSLLNEKVGGLEVSLRNSAEQRGVAKAREDEYERFQGMVRRQQEQNSQLVDGLREEIKELNSQLVEKEGRARAAEERLKVVESGRGA